METTNAHPCGHPVVSGRGLPLEGAAALERIAAGCLRCRRAETAARDAEYVASGRAAADRAAAAAREAAQDARVAEWVPQARARAQAALRAAGCVRELTSRSGSNYYVHAATKTRVRISDHAVPETDQRRSDRSHGARKCCDVEIVLCGQNFSGRTIAISDAEFERQLAEVLEILADG